MRLIMTGATGSIGRELVPELAGIDGIELVLCGRSLDRLEATFPEGDHPGVTKVTYGSLEEIIREGDVVVHLAVLNNDQNGSAAEFAEINVDLAVRVGSMARRRNALKMINFSSVHALDEDNRSHYALSKRAALPALAAIEGLNVETIYLPFFYGNLWGGKLKALNRLPRFLADALFQALKAWKSTVHVSRVVDHIVASAGSASTGSAIVAEPQSGNGVYRFVTLLINLSISLLIVVLLGWLFVVVALCIKFGSAGPVFFSQDRVGKDRTIFRCRKFRTMTVNTESVGSHEVDASRITGVGRFLRRTKIDELPQVLNIFRGEMGFVGPRPCLPNQTEVIEERDRRGVYAVLPGITGLAQIGEIDMSTPEKLAITDARYRHLQCVSLDIRIALLTLMARGQGDRTLKD